MINLEYFSVKDIAELLSVNEETVRRWIREEKLKAERGTGRQGSKITSDSLKEFLEANKGLMTTAVASTLGITPKALLGAAGLVAGIISPISTATISGVSWLSVLKSKNNDKKEVRVQLLEKELELENMAMNLKNEISSKQNELELVESQIAKLKEIIKELK